MASIVVMAELVPATRVFSASKKQDVDAPASADKFTQSAQA
jgi:hypothetical protein